MKSANALLSHPGVAPFGPGLEPRRPSHSRTLAPLPLGLVDHLIQEDRTNLKGLARIGIARPLDEPVVLDPVRRNPDEWKSGPDGWQVWSLEVVSPGALGIRLGVESVHLPAGARLLVYDAASPTASARPVTPETLRGETTVWMETVFAERVVLECQAPPGADLQELSLSVRELSHFYRDAGPPVDPRGPTKEGSCHLDVTCYPAWTNEARAVARMVFVKNSTSFLCTGALVNDTDPSTFIDYFLTANHCITTQPVASTLECYWFYQTSVCNGPAPSLASLPRTTGGADLLAGSEANDFSLLRLRQVTPTNVYYLGWSAATPSTGENLTGIHHPGGTYKRISFGSRVDLDQDFWIVQWSEGVTESGSSGSPLLDAQHLVVGQLYGGNSSCLSPSGLDYYGRFDHTYPFVEAWLHNRTRPTLIEALDSDVSITTGGSLPWYGESLDSHDGVDAATSGSIGANSQSDLSLSLTGPGTLGFWWKVSSEAGFDELRVYQDEILLQAISGEVGWDHYSQDIPDGPHTIRWSYVKDAYVSEGRDAGWVDEVTWTGLSPIPAGPSLRMTRHENQVALWWPTNFPGYSLQSAAHPHSAAWSTVVPSPLIVGTNYVVTNTVAPAPRYYRLIK